MELRDLFKDAARKFAKQAEGLMRDAGREIGSWALDKMGELKDHVLYDHIGVDYCEDPSDDVLLREAYVKRRLRLRQLPKPTLEIDTTKNPESSGEKEEPHDQTLVDRFLKAGREAGWTDEDIQDFFDELKEGWSMVQELTHPFRAMKRDRIAVRRYANHGSPLTAEEEDELDRERAWARILQRQNRDA